VYTSIEEKLRFEIMISELCSAFVHVHAEKVDDEISRWLSFIVTYLEVDRGTLFQITADHTSGELTHTWAATKSLSLDKNSVAVLREGVFVLPWTVAKMLREEPVVFSSINELPEDATADRQFFEENGAKSNVTIPLSIGGEVIGAIAFSSVRSETRWSADLIGRLQMIAHVFACALARKRADIEQKNAIDRYQTLFEAASDAIFVLSEDRIVECNRHCVAMFGCQNKSDFISYGPWEFSTPQQADGEDSEEKIKRLLDLAKTGTSQKFFWKCRRKDESLFEAEVSLNAFKVTGEILLLAIVRDITEHRQTQEILKESNQRLEAERILLAEKNSALRTVLAQVEQQRIEYEEATCSSLEHVFAPLLAKLRAGDGRLNKRELAELEEAFASIVGKGVNTFKENFAKLSPRETEICELIVQGLSSKEISEALSIAPQTTHKHREIIRRKLKIQNLEINLPTYLRGKL
jgi:PAS domain S-box-containing protein